MLAACQGRNVDPSTHAAVPAPSASAALADSRALLSAELRRDSAAISAEALSSRDLGARRLAARAVSRIADARASELSLLALADEDAEVSTWGAYGVGYACRGRELKAVRALVARAASLGESAAPAPLLSPSEAIADALGRCATPDAESTLRAWLGGPQGRAEAAALGLGRIATQNGKLDDATLVALLDAADRPQNPLKSALFPLTRVAALNASTSDRARALAERVLADHGAASEFAVRVLGRTGDAGTTALGAMLGNATLSAGIRAQAVRELATLGAPGQQALWAAFEALPGVPPADAELDSASYGPLAALLDALRPPILSSGAKLQAFSDLALGAQDSVTVKRRKVHLRCTAAALLAGGNFQRAQLLACDPAPESTQRELAVLAVLGRNKLRGARKTAYLAHASASDGLVREAAIELLTQHNELDEAYQVLAEALSAKSLGVVASAAHVLASYPERATRGADTGGDAHSAPNPDVSVVKALTQAYADARARNSVEIQSLLLDAIGALQILTLKDAANGACASDNPTLREHAQKALRLLGEQARKCDDFKPGTDAIAPAKATNSLLTLETDAGTLTLELDASYAPNAVARVLTLAQSGFYDGIVIHRVVPGFVAQFGDPEGDGYGGDDKPPLRCETSPVPFQTGAIGVALSGRDTGASQLFVTLGRYPHLDGQYAWLGQAGPGWDRVAAGDRIVHARVSATAR